MRCVAFAICLAGAMLVASISVGHAQATRTWISGVGNDVNTCARDAPCKTFAGAISKTADGGEIDTLDPGGFGAVTVTKSITLASEGTGEGGILVAGTNGVTVNCATNPNCVVILRGLQIDGGPIGSNSLAGVKFFAGGKLVIENSSIRNFSGGSPNGYGVAFTPNSAATLVISNTTITTNGQSGVTGGGIFVQPTGAGSAKVNLTNVLSINNTTGLEVHGTSTVTVDRTTLANNAKNGVYANGGQSVVRLSNSVITGNQTGLNPGNSGAIISSGNNVIRGNATDGAPTGMEPLE